MTGSAKNEFQLSAVPGEELTRRLAYLASVDNGSVLTGGFVKDSPTIQREEKERATQHALATLEFLLQNDPAYAALHQETGQALLGAQTRLDELAHVAQEALEAAQADLDAALQGAAQLPDGRHVFRNQNGDVFFLNGSRVADEDAASVLWRGNEPTFEEVTALNERVIRLGDILTDIQIGQVDIGDMQERLEDENDPPSADELRGMQERADSIVSGLEERLDAENTRSFARPTDPSVQNAASVSLSVPEL